MSHTRNEQVVYHVPLTVILKGSGCEWFLDSIAGNGMLRWQPAPSTYINDDPWAILQRFMRLSTRAEVLAFLNETGYFSLFESAIPIEGGAEQEQNVQIGRAHV